MLPDIEYIGLFDFFIFVFFRNRFLFFILFVSLLNIISNAIIYFIAHNLFLNLNDNEICQYLVPSPSKLSNINGIYYFLQCLPFPL